MVFERLFKGRRQSRPAEAVYDAVVAQSRHPAYYTEYGVADGLEERFDLLVLHIHLVIRQLTREGAGSRAQELFDAMFFDMDRTLRGIGVGDMSVGKRVKDMVRAYYGRTAAYDSALAEGGDEALAIALDRNIFGADPAAETAPGDGAVRLAGQVRAMVAELAAQSVDDIAAGRIRFPDPRSTR